MRNPFKLLDAFTLKDRKSFFGRDDEIEELYNLVFKASILLVYGFSGTGKTSLIQCGLASRFDGTDWFPFFIRRQDNINKSLELVLRKHCEEDHLGDFPNMIQEIFQTYLRPVYLIFDQFEELYILGSQEEQKLFITNIKNLLTANLPCKIVLVLREEYLGSLYSLERSVPSIYHHKLRVEPMRRSRVAQVIMASFERFNIQFTSSKDSILNQIIDYISFQKSGIELPYLQLYLHSLYQQVTSEQQFSDNILSQWPNVLVSESTMDAVGDMEKVLEKFLINQIRSIQERINQKDPQITSDFVSKLLDEFVTAEGTKKPLAFEFTNSPEAIVIADNASLSWPQSTVSSLTETIRSLESSRILRIGQSHIELSHDILARLLDDLRSHEQRQISDVKRRLTNAYHEYEVSKSYLSERQLADFEIHLPLLNLTANDEMRVFIEDSKKKVRADKIARQEALVHKRKQKQLIRILGGSIASVIFCGLVIGFFYTLRQRKTAEEQNSKLKRQIFNFYLQRGQYHKSEAEYDLALMHLDSAEENLSFIDSSAVSALRKYQANWPLIRKIMENADSLISQKDYRAALSKLDSANRLDSDNYIKGRIKTLSDLIESEYREYIRDAKSWLQADNKVMAIQSYEAAYDLKPSDDLLKVISDLRLQ